MAANRTLGRLGLILSLGALGCDKDGDDPHDTDSAALAARALVEIVSPEGGSTFTLGEAVQLQVSVTDEQTGEALEHGTVAWTADGSWVSGQASSSVTDLPLGSYSLEVKVAIGSRELDDSVHITVEEVLDPIHYQGVLSSVVYLESNEYDVDDEQPCEGTVDLDLDGSWAVTGTGQCHVELFWGYVVWDVIFEIDGQRTDDTIRGDLFFYDDQGTRYEQPYEGSASDQHVSTSFSAEHTSPDGMLRYSGTMELDAVD